MRRVLHKVPNRGSRGSSTVGNDRDILVLNPQGKRAEARQPHPITSRATRRVLVLGQRR